MFYRELENKILEIAKKFSQAFYQTVGGQSVWWGTLVSLELQPELMIVSNVSIVSKSWAICNLGVDTFVMCVFYVGVERFAISVYVGVGRAISGFITV